MDGIIINPDSGVNNPCFQQSVRSGMNCQIVNSPNNKTALINNNNTGPLSIK